ncbi:MULTISPECIES: PilZ domain-containing protein [unclassified Pseudomonas]|uniref:PilZ domain-containing protein n=1 Tax=unclassified Pseudomonas TaxID=196821 RepID=UPI0017841B78|nr:MULTISPECIES: PilZ domain-containing protein [unclassified Pseudomonas]MBD8594788.1 PilZ domain-containing protein [Pseudomonas sp. CFBP 8758]MBD8730334.1 PilZ domain-containing protein [Pseudomonas sp. CFBP 13710]
MSTSDEEDRREYYRIDDRIALEITILPASETAGEDMLQDASPLFDLLGEMHLAEFETQHLLRQLGEADRAVEAVLKAQNKRIDLLGQVVAQTLVERIGEARPVVLSEGGLAFFQQQPMEENTRLALRIALMPQALGLSLKASVTNCIAVGNDQFEIGTQFVDISDAQRQLLARYILHKQQVRRRQARERQDATTD